MPEKAEFCFFLGVIFSNNSDMVFATPLYCLSAMPYISYKRNDLDVISMEYQSYFCNLLPKTLFDP